MRIEELSVGDWVCIKSKDKIIEIAQINGQTEKVRAFGREHFFDLYGLSDIDPIPLTPEILEKNGFCPPPKHCGYHHLTVGNKEVFVCIDNGFSEFSHYSKGFVSDEEYINKLEISHSMSVHELQHALRLAGIEKEIEV